MKKEVLEDIKKEINEIRDKLNRLEKGKEKLSPDALIIEFDKVINNLYFRILKLKKLINNGNDI